LTERAEDLKGAKMGKGQAGVFDYIERFYNPKRRHSTIEYVSHVDFERQAGLAQARISYRFTGIVAFNASSPAGVLQ
jgi:putative transposase